MSRAERFLYWTLRSKANPLAYLMAYASFAIGFFFTFFSDLPDVQRTLLYKSNIIGNAPLWGVILVLCSTLVLVGLAKHIRGLVRFGAMGNFMMWIFACLLFLSHNYWYAFASFGVLHVLAQGYFYLVASIDSLWNERYT